MCLPWSPAAELPWSSEDRPVARDAMLRQLCQPFGYSDGTSTIPFMARDVRGLHVHIPWLSFLQGQNEFSSYSKYIERINLKWDIILLDCKFPHPRVGAGSQNPIVVCSDWDVPKGRKADTSTGHQLCSYVLFDGNLLGVRRDQACINLAGPHATKLTLQRPQIPYLHPPLGDAGGSQNQNFTNQAGLLQGDATGSYLARLPEASSQKSLYLNPLATGSVRRYPQNHVKPYWNQREAIISDDCMASNDVGRFFSTQPSLWTQSMASDVYGNVGPRTEQIHGSLGHLWNPERQTMRFREASMSRGIMDDAAQFPIPERPVDTPIFLQLDRDDLEAGSLNPYMVSARNEVNSDIGPRRIHNSRRGNRGRKLNLTQEQKDAKRARREIGACAECHRRKVKCLHEAPGIPVGTQSVSDPNLRLRIPPRDTVSQQSLENRPNFDPRVAHTTPVGHRSDSTPFGISGGDLAFSPLDSGQAEGHGHYQGDLLSPLDHGLHLGPPSSVASDLLSPYPPVAMDQDNVLRGVGYHV